MSIMNKVTTYLRKLSSATHIRMAYAKSHTVRNRLMEINFLIAFFLFCFICSVLVSTFTPTMNKTEYAFIATAFFLIVMWLYGYRRAVAFSKNEREAYMAKTWKAFHNVCRGLNKLLWFALFVVVLAILVHSQNFLVDVFPPLEGIADGIIVQLNKMLSSLEALIG